MSVTCGGIQKGAFWRSISALAHSCLQLLNLVVDFQTISAMVKSATSKPPQPARVLQIPGKGKIPISQAEEQKGKDFEDTTLLKGKKRKKAKKEKTLTNSKDKDLVKEASSTAVGSKAPAKPAKLPSDPSPASPASPAAPAQRPAPRVLQIPGKSFSSEKRRFMPDKVADIRSKPQAPKQKRKVGDTEDTAEFKKTLKDVLNFVVPQLGATERRQYEQAKVRALGGTWERRPHEPYAVLQRRWKRQEEARQQRLEEEKTLGVSFSAVKHRTRHSGEAAMNRKEQARIEKKRRKESDILGLGAGARERRGMVVLPKNRVKAYS